MASVLKRLSGAVGGGKVSGAATKESGPELEAFRTLGALDYRSQA
jgi:hypothetical protein